MTKSSDRFSPIFIVGAPRSGTTLLRVMLNRHPAIGICDETYFFYYLYGRRRRLGDLSKVHVRRMVIDRYLALNRIKLLGLDMESLARTLMEEASSYQEFFKSLVRFYAQSNEKTIAGEKTPDHALVAEMLCDWYPDSTLIHLVRDPRDVVASLVRVPWASQNVLSNARLWLRYTDHAQRCATRHNYLQVRYEDLVADPEVTLSNICGKVGVDFNPTMLKADQNAKAARWWFERAQGELSTERLSQWREQLSPRQVASIEWLVGPAMQQFGYELTGASTPLMATTLATEAVDYVYRKLRQVPRMWYYWVQPTRLAKEEAHGW